LIAGNGSLTLNWTIVVLADSYAVYYGTSQTPPSTPAKTGLTGTSTTITGLVNDTTYYVWVEAVNVGGRKLGTPSSKILTLQAPAAPTLIAGNGSLAVNWTIVALADFYNVYYGTAQTLPSTPAKTGLTGTSTTITGLVNDTTYYVWVEAVNAGGRKLGISSSKMITLQAPAAPVLTAGKDSLSVSWVAVGMADSYNVFYNTGRSPLVSLAQTGITGTSTTITGLTNNTYYVWIEAVNSGGKTMGASASVVIKGGYLRIVLDWTETPADLDLHLEKEGGSGGYHILHSNMHSESDGSVTFDRDNMNGFGPEVITVMEIDLNAVYHLYIHDFTNSNSNTSTALSRSGAVVRVYDNGGLLNTFTVPLNWVGTRWDVFRIVNGRIEQE
jgi:stress response protein SCP2